MPEAMKKHHTANIGETYKMKQATYPRRGFATILFLFCQRKIELFTATTNLTDIF